MNCQQPQYNHLKIFSIEKREISVPLFSIKTVRQGFLVVLYIVFFLQNTREKILLIYAVFNGFPKKENQNLTNCIFVIII